jgi:hypothetical protein
MAVEQEERDHNLSLLDKPKVNHATWQTPEEAMQDARRASSDVQSSSGDVQGKKIRLKGRAGAARFIALREGGHAAAGDQDE